MYSQNDWRDWKGAELYHHGIRGQKWGVRRYQNSDGSLTDEGRKRYGMRDVRLSFNGRRDITTAVNKLRSSNIIQDASKELNDSYMLMRQTEKRLNKAESQFFNNKEELNKYAKIVGDEAYAYRRKKYPQAKEMAEQAREYYSKIKGIDAATAIWDRYAQDHKELDDLAWNASNARDAFEKKSREVSDAILKDYGDIKVSYADKYSRIGRTNISASGALSLALRSASKDRVEAEINRKIFDAEDKVRKAENAYRDYSDQQREKLIPKYEKEYEKQFGKKYDKNDYDAWEWVDGSIRDNMPIDKTMSKILDDMREAEKEYLKIKNEYD